MKPVYMIAALAVSFTTTAANAVEFNTEALKSMQEEGHKIVEQAQGKTYRTSGGLCLDVAGAALVIRPCNAKSQSQIWKIDTQSRLVAHDGRCVAGAQLQQCGAVNAQKWKVDEKKRLANANQQCLQVQGNPPKAGSNVIAPACSPAPNQVWQ